MESMVWKETGTILIRKTMGRHSTLHSTIQEILLISSKTFLAALTISINLIDNKMTTFLDGTHLKTSSRIIRIYTDVFSIHRSTVLRMCSHLHRCSKSLTLTQHLLKTSVNLKQKNSTRKRPENAALRRKLARMELFISQRQSLTKMEKYVEKLGSEALQQTETRRTIFWKTQHSNSAENRQSLQWNTPRRMKVSRHWKKIVQRRRIISMILSLPRKEENPNLSQSRWRQTFPRFTRPRTRRTGRCPPPAPPRGSPRPRDPVWDQRSRRGCLSLKMSPEIEDTSGQQNPATGVTVFSKCIPDNLHFIAGKLPRQRPRIPSRSRKRAKHPHHAWSCAASATGTLGGKTSATNNSEWEDGYLEINFRSVIEHHKTHCLGLNKFSPSSNKIPKNNFNNLTRREVMAW